jgi:hypothetical protein
MADNLKTQQQLNEAIKQRNALLEAGEESISRQAKLYAGLLDTISGKKSSDALDELITKLEDSRKKMGEMADEAKDSFGDLNNIFDESTQKADVFVASTSTMSEKLQSAFPVAAGVAIGAISGLSQGFKNLKAVGQAAFSIFSGIIGAAWNLGKAILAIPINIFRGLFDAAQQGGSNELMQAFENIRKEFGSFKQDVAKNVITASTTMRGELANTGLSVWRVFGNLAERLKYFTEITKQMGPVMHLVGTEIAQNAEAFGAFQKGLGIAGEEMRFVAERAVNTGQSLMSLTTEIGSMSLQMAADFGLSAKMVSRDVGKMLKDVKNFGSLSIKEMTQVSVFTQKLGIGFDKLLGTIQKFDTFEDAATNAAKLSQAFGVQIDAVEIMKEQDPARRLDMLRKSFATAGVTVDKFSRQEMAAVEAITGLDAATAKAALSSSKLGLNYDQVAKSGEAAKKSQMSQEQVLKRLGDAIERIFPPGGQKFGGFFEAFGAGITNGIKMSPEWIRMMRNIQLSFIQVYQAGREFGMWLVKAFPGMKKIFDSIGGMFSSGKIASLFKNITEEFKSFVTNISTGKFSFAEMMKNIKKHFFNFFDMQSAEGKNLLSGTKEFLKAFATIAGQGIKWAVDQLREGLTKGAEFLADPAKFMESLAAGKGAGAEAGGFVWEILKPLFDALSDKKMWQALGNSAIKFLGAAWNFIEPQLIDAVKALPMKFWMIAGGILFGPAVISAAFGAITGVVVKKAAEAFTGLMGKVLAKAGGASKTTEVVKAAKGASEISSALPKASFGERIKDFINSIGQISWTGMAKAAIIIAGLTAIFGFAMIKFTSAIGNIVAEWNKAGVKADDVATVMGALSKTFISAGLVAAIAAGIGKVASIKDTLAGLLSIGIVVGAMGVATWAMSEALGDINISKLDPLSKIMLTVGELFVTAGKVAILAAGVGLIATSFGGAGAVVMLAGLATLGLIITGIAVTAIEIVKKLDALPASQELMTKTDIFVKVVGAIESLARTAVAAMNAASLSVTDFLVGGTSAKDKINSMTTMLESLLGTKENGKGVLGLVTSMIKIVQEIPNSETISKNAETLSSILGSVTSLTQVLAKQVPESSSGVAMIKALIGGKSNEFEDAGNATELLMNQMQNFIVRIVKSVTSEAFQKQFTDSAIKGLDNVKKIIDIVGTVTKIFSEIKPQQAGFSPVSFDGPIEMIKSLLGMGKGDGTSIVSIVDMLNTANGLKSLETFDPKKLGNIEKVLKSVDKIQKLLITSPSQVSGPPLAFATSPVENALKSVENIITSLNSITNSVETMNDQKINSTFARIDGIIEKAAKMSDAVRSLAQNPIQIDATLKQMRAAAALGIEKEYKIKADNITIAVNLNVTMKAGEVEHVILQRNDSSIRKALNSTATTDNGRTLATEGISGTPKP